MKREALNHPKFRLLARDLKVSVNEARGICCTLWMLAGISFPRGDVGRLTNEELAVGIDHDGDPDLLVASLLKRRLLDDIPDEDGRLYVHDWHEHADSFVHARLAKAVECFANGALPYLPHDRLDGSTRKRIRAQYETKFGHGQPSESPEKQGEAPMPSGELPENSRRTPDLSHGSPGVSGNTPPHSQALPSQEIESENFSGRPREEDPRDGAPPWWDLTDDDTARYIAIGIRESKRYETTEPSEAAVMDLLDRVRGGLKVEGREFNGDDLIRHTVDSFKEAAESAKERKYSNPVATLKDWMLRKEAEWRPILRQRWIDSDRGQGKPPARRGRETIEEANARVKRELANVH